jgi:hypothetical protein
MNQLECCPIVINLERHGAARRYLGVPLRPKDDPPS